MTVETGAAERALDRLIGLIDAATFDIAKTGSEEVGRAARANAPNLSGQLAASIVEEAPTNVGTRYGMAGVHAGPYFWTAKVGPTVVYGRIRALGGDIPKKGHRASTPHGYLKWYWEGRPVFKKRVHQGGNKYLLNALEDYEAAFLQMATNRWAAAIEAV